MAAAGEQRRHGGFAAARFSHQGRETAPGELHRHILQDGSGLVVGEVHPLQGQRAVLRHRAGAPGRFRRVQQPEDLLAGRHAVHRHMEEAAQKPHGQEKIRRQQQNHQAALQADSPRRQTAHRQHHAGRRAAVGDQVHDGDGVELHGQHPHGDPAEGLGLGVHLLVLALVGLVDFQGGEALEIFEKGIPQGGVLAPVAAQQLFGPSLHRHDGRRDQRHTDQQHRRRGQVDGRQHRKQRQRRQHGVEELGQILAEIDLQLVHSLHGHLDHLAGAHRFPVGAAQPQQLFVDHPPQPGFHRPAGKVAHPGRSNGTAEPHSQGRHS